MNAARPLTPLVHDLRPATPLTSNVTIIVYPPNQNPFPLQTKKTYDYLYQYICC